MANRFLRATGNWNGPVWAATSGGAAGSASTPTAADTVHIEADFTVTLTADAECGRISHGNGGLSLSSYTLAVNGSYEAWGNFNPKTLNLGGGHLLITSGGTPTSILSLTQNTSVISGSSLITLRPGYSRAGVHTASKQFNDFILDLGTAGTSSYNVPITGSPTFRSLIIQSKNSAAHTVEFSEGEQDIKTDKLVLVGSSTANRLKIVNGNPGIGLTSFMLPATGSVYGQFVDMTDDVVYFSGPSGTVPQYRAYIGSNSLTWGLDPYAPIAQDPPKISTLVDDFTEMSDDSEIDINWNKEVSGLGDISLSGSDGVVVFAFGTNGVSRLMSKDTYDVVSQYLYIRGLSGQAGYAGIFVPYQDHPIGPWAPIEGPEDYRVGFTGTTVVVEKLNGEVWEFDSDYAVPDAYQGEELWRSVRVGARVSTSNPAQSLVIQSIGVGDEPPSSGNFLPFFMP